MRYIVTSITPGGVSSIIDAVDEEFAAKERGAEDADVYVSLVSECRVFRKSLQVTLNETVPPAARP